MLLPKQRQRTARLALQWVLVCVSALLAAAAWHRAVLPLLFAVETLFLLPPIFRRIYDVPGETWWNAALLAAACAVALLSLRALCSSAAEAERRTLFLNGNFACIGALTGLQSKANWPKILYMALLALLALLMPLIG